MERVEFRNSRNLKLVGNLYAGTSDAGIILAHGFTSDKSALGRFDALAEVLSTTGYTVLAFDFSGCGESDAEILAAHNMVDDLRSAIAFVRAEYCRRIGLYGHSLGGLICLRCSSPGIIATVVSGAPTDRMHYDWREYYSPEQLADLNDRGYLTTLDRTGKERMIGRRMLMDFDEINQELLLKNVACPVLLIHGNDKDDPEELTVLAYSRKGIAYLPAGSRVEIVEGANHTFINHWQSVCSLAAQWYLDHIPLS